MRTDVTHAIDEQVRGGIDAAYHRSVGDGLAAFARLLAWIFKKFHDQTLALLTGFIFGSLSILWPWKDAIIQTFEKGDGLKEKVIGYTYSLPELNAETAIAGAIMVAGIIAIAGVETAANKMKTD